MGKLFDTMQAGAYSAVGLLAYYSGASNLIEPATSATISSLGYVSNEQNIEKKINAALLPPLVISINNFVAGNSGEEIVYNIIGSYTLSWFSLGMSGLRDADFKELMNDMKNNKDIICAMFKRTIQKYTG